MSVPIRTCVGCGVRAAKPSLLRIVATPAGLRLDATRRGAGRGAYLHRDASCWAAFARRRGAVRSLRVSPHPAERAQLVAALTTATPAP